MAHLLCGFSCVFVDVQQGMFACLALSQRVNILCFTFLIFRTHVILLKECSSPVFLKALVVAIVSRHSCDGAFCCAPHPPPHPPTRLSLAFISNARKSAPFTMRLFQSRGGAPPFSERL